MTHVNTENYPDPDTGSDYVPPGQYLGEIVSINPNKTTKDGEEMWDVGGKVVAGEYKDKPFRDNWVINSANVHSQRRQVLIQHRVAGLPKKYEGELTPEMFIGKKVLVTFVDGTYKGYKRHEVDFGGYEALDTEDPRQQKLPDMAVPKEEDIPEEEIPF